MNANKPELSFQDLMGAGDIQKAKPIDDYVEVDKRDYATLEATDKVNGLVKGPRRKSITAMAKKQVAKRDKMKQHLLSWGEYKSGAGSASVFAKYQELGGFDDVDHDGYDGGISDFQSLVYQIDGYVDQLNQRDKDLLKAEYQDLLADRVLYWSRQYGVSQLRYEKEHRRIVLKMALTLDVDKLK